MIGVDDSVGRDRREDDSIRFVTTTISGISEALTMAVETIVSVVARRFVGEIVTVSVAASLGVTVITTVIGVGEVSEVVVEPPSTSTTEYGVRLSLF